MSRHQPPQSSSDTPVAYTNFAVSSLVIHVPVSQPRDLEVQVSSSVSVVSSSRRAWAWA